MCKVPRSSSAQAGRPTVGIGCTAALRSLSPKHGPHRCHVAVWAPSHATHYRITMTKGARSREEEDTAVSALILYSMAESIGPGVAPAAVTSALADVGLVGACACLFTCVHYFLYVVWKGCRPVRGFARAWICICLGVLPALCMGCMLLTCPMAATPGSWNASGEGPLDHIESRVTVADAAGPLSHLLTDPAAPPVLCLPGVCGPSSSSPVPLCPS